MNSEKPHFKTRARLLCQLGEQLIKSESIALLELVKNAYDADASFCNVEITDPENAEKCKIIIEDDGIGMDIKTIKDVWLEIGTDNKQDKKKSGLKSPKYGRTPLGEKGIGRLGVHRLGKKITLISRMKNCKECVLKINWEEIENSKYIEDFPIEISERDAQTFERKHGTKIIIEKIRKPWIRGGIRNIARQISSLNSPFEAIGSFTANLHTNNNWLNGLLEFENIKDMHLYSFNLLIENNQITDFSYDFKPYESLSKATPRHLSYEDVKSRCLMIDEDEKELKLNTWKIGKIRIEGRIYDFDGKILSLGLEAGKKELQTYMSQNGGVRVFRDNMRVWDYGEAGDDWLDLDAKRVNSPSTKIGNKQILAAVYIDGKESSDLVEKTNREGFVDNDAYNAFKKACVFAIEMVEFFRNEDKELLRRLYNGKVTGTVTVTDSIENIRSIIEKKINDIDLIQELNRHLDRIRDDYSRITNNLIKSAGAGLNLIAVLHQIQKIINNLKYNVTQENNAKKIRADVKQLEILTEGYGVLVRNYKPKKQNLNNLLKNAIKNESLRFSYHKINIIEGQSKNLDGICSDNYFINAIMNLFDNSIWWLNYTKVNDPQIYVAVTDEYDGYNTVIVADNGPGFLPAKEELGTPFLTAKPAGLGMGIGLHVTKEIMKSLNGQLLFPEKDDFDIPNKFKNGAIVALAFKKGE